MTVTIAEGILAATVDMPVPFGSVVELPSRAPDAEYAYGGDPSQRVYLWRPESGASPATPVVVLIHGGCWMAEYGVDHIYPLASALAAAGLSVWAPEYRRLGEHGGGWPGTFEDVARSVDLLRAQQDLLLDPDNVVFVGHSAGAHLALLAAARAAFHPEHPMHDESAFRPRGVVGLAAITHLASYGSGTTSCQRAVKELLAGSPDERPERYRLASPALLPRPVPVTLVHGPADPIVPLDQPRAIADAEIHLVDGAGHFDLIHPGTPAFAELLERLRSLLDDA
ncbi:MAG: alpha/beta fold hydrolase [Pseudomonadales bacterium]|nr:alpha/beta hydrolase [Pseudomonadales bacterium]NIX08295.1 alpha/beta fold hydrolase [Pseudomonadales bacterium]